MAPQNLNITLRDRTQQPPTSGLAARCRMHWYGHVKRLPPEHPTHVILYFDAKAAAVPPSPAGLMPLPGTRSKWAYRCPKKKRLVNLIGSMPPPPSKTPDDDDDEYSEN